MDLYLFKGISVKVNTTPLEFDLDMPILISEPVTGTLFTNPFGTVALKIH